MFSFIFRGDIISAGEYLYATHAIKYTSLEAYFQLFFARLETSREAYDALNSLGFRLDDDEIRILIVHLNGVDVAKCIYLKGVENNG